jgi:hypothetical protein
MALLVVFAAVASARAKTSAEVVNGSNDPLSANLGLMLENQYAASYYGDPGADGNMLELRATVPHELGGLPQLFDVSVPIVTSRDGDESRTSGLGDVVVSDQLRWDGGWYELGAGPQLTAPSATDDRLGDGKWQAGLASAAVLPHEDWGLLAAVVTYQHSFASDGHDRPTRNDLTVQPFVTLNLPDQFYLRSTATWTWDLQQGEYAIPFGLGVGKVWALTNETTVNVFLEPQYTVAHEGDVPQWQLVVGFNVQGSAGGGG